MIVTTDRNSGNSMIEKFYTIYIFLSRSFDATVHQDGSQK